MAQDTTKSPKKSSSGSKFAKKPISIMESLLSSAFHKDESSSSKSSKRPEGKDAKERTKPESKITQSGSKHGTQSTKSSHHKSSSSKTSKSSHVPSGKFSKSEFFRDESQAPVNVSRYPGPVRSTHPKITTTFTSEHDKKMASRQLELGTLSETELQEQEQWAQVKLVESGSCPAGWCWQRYTAPEGYSQFNGYRCYGGAITHLVSHDLLAEGRNRLFRLNRDTNWWEGPFDAKVVRRELLNWQGDHQQETNTDEAQPLPQGQFDQILRKFFSPH